MDDRQRHEMILGQHHPSGVQNWYCPTCGQSLLVTWTPRFMTVIRNVGNKSAIHTLGNYLQSGSRQLMALDDDTWREEHETFLDEAGLAPWIAWMEAVGFEKFWNENVD